MGWVTRDRIVELVRFAVVGVATFGLDVGGLVVLRTYTPMPLAMDVAVAFSVASLVNFVASRQWVFEQATQGAHPRAALARYVVLVVLGLLVTTATVPGLTAAGMDYRAAKTVMSVVVGAANYLLLPWWVFRGTPRDESAPSLGLEPSEVELDRRV
jgi:putative flippase GtrA